MKKLLFAAIIATCFGCNHPTDPSPAAPVITIVDIHGNDAIDATVEYTIAGIHTETYLIVDHQRINVAVHDTVYSGTFPAHAAQRSVVAVNAGTRSTMDF